MIRYYSKDHEYTLHYHKSQTADITWSENYWKITRHVLLYQENRIWLVSHFEITVHIRHYTHKWILNIKIKHSIIFMTFGHYKWQKVTISPYRSMDMVWKSYFLHNSIHDAKVPFTIFRYDRAFTLVFGTVPAGTCSRYTPFLVVWTGSKESCSR